MAVVDSTPPTICYKGQLILVQLCQVQFCKGGIVVFVCVNFVYRLMYNRTFAYSELGELESVVLELCTFSGMAFCNFVVFLVVGVCINYDSMYAFHLCHL